MVQSNKEAVETFAILPIGKFMSMEKRLKKSEESDQRPPTPKSSEKSESVENLDSPPSSPKAPNKKKEVKMNYRAAQIKKLLHHVEKKNGSEKITSLENLEELIKCALRNS